ncbi:MAG: EAL domain-containing protein [Microcella sp.]|uniref:putative bifunctional diguanylate cyclase/phosphodiesterase n=1 Tax=Microcella sp. TaxID=1913979 RepID=UPI003315ABA1
MTAELRGAGTVRPDPSSSAATEQLLARALDTVSEGSLITDVHRNTIYANAAFTTITGYRADEIMGTNCRFLQGPATGPDDVQRIRDCLNAGTVFQGTILNYRKDGTPFWNHLTISPLHDEAGEITHFVSVQRDVSDAIEERDRLSHEARHDALTGLPNRTGLRGLLRRAMSSADERGDVVAIGLLDLDHFKQVNDRHGHPAGDQVLIEVGHRIPAALRRNDSVSRVSGDEFVIIVSDLDPEHAAHQVAEVAQRIREAIVRPIRLPDGSEITVTTSMGVSLYPSDGSDSQSLYAAADRALYRAKGRRGSEQWWELTAPSSAPRDTPSETQPPQKPAFSYPGAPRHHVDGHLEMYMQPIVELRTGRVSQFEALARIRRPDGSIMLPDQFLPQYTTDHLRELFWIGMHQALGWVARWQEAGHDWGVSLNVPPEVFAAPDSTQLVIDALTLLDVEPSKLSLELLESSELAPHVSDEAIDELVRLGVKLNLDDISSGYSTLKRVTELPFDVIKIDRQIFDNIHTRSLHVMTVLAAITKLGADFGYGVTVEGIENRERLEVSSVLGARYGQGYLFARPMPADEVVAWSAEADLPGGEIAITTALGALAYHWSRTRAGGMHHQPRAECPLTGYFAGHDAQGSALHDRLHENAEHPPEVSALLLSWLIEQVAGRH